MVLVMTLIALLGLIATMVSAQQAGPAQGQQGKPRQAAFQLTAEQKAQLEAKLKELRAANAKPEEINAAIVELFKGWGLEPPRGRALLMLQLTQDQRKELQAKLKQMRAANAKPEEVRAAITDMLKGWGLALPQEQGKGQGAGNRFGANLTEEQRTQLQAKIKELRAANAKPEEIRAAVAEMYKGWGIEMPQGKGRGGAGRAAIKDLLQGLTDEQRQQVLTKADEMQKAGSTPEEIRRTIMEMIKGFGDKA